MLKLAAAAMSRFDQQNCAIGLLKNVFGVAEAIEHPSHTAANIG
jgi:hypothetical protein